MHLSGAESCCSFKYGEFALYRCVLPKSANVYTFMTAASPGSRSGVKKGETVRPTLLSPKEVAEFPREREVALLTVASLRLLTLNDLLVRFRPNNQGNQRLIALLNTLALTAANNNPVVAGMERAKVVDYRDIVIAIIREKILSEVAMSSSVLPQLLAQVELAIASSDHCSDPHLILIAYALEQVRNEMFWSAFPWIAGTKTAQRKVLANLCKRLYALSSPDGAASVKEKVRSYIQSKSDWKLDDFAVMTAPCFTPHKTVDAPHSPGHLIVDAWKHALAASYTSTSVSDISSSLRAKTSVRRGKNEKEKATIDQTVELQHRTAHLIRTSYYLYYISKYIYIIYLNIFINTNIYRHL